MAIDAEKQVRKLLAPVPNLKGVTKPQGTDLTTEQKKTLDAVLEHFAKPDYEIPGEKDGEGKLTDEEKFWLSYECMLRYLRATKWVSAEVAIKRLEETLSWRREYGLYDERFTAEHVEPEATTGKEVTFGFDVDGRPALYLCPSRQNTEESIRQIQFMIFGLERALDLMGLGVESLALMIDYGQKASKFKGPSWATSRSVLHILQTHYPERLGRALIINVPFLLNAFYKMITPFIDPLTRDKMRFNPRPVQDGLFTADNLWVEFGGDIVFEYEHEVYWPNLLETANKRRADMMARWKELGGTVGIKEWDMKGGDSQTEVSSAQPEGNAVQTREVGEQPREEAEEQELKGARETVEVEPAVISVEA